MANKKSDTSSIKSGDQVAKDDFIEDLDEEELKEIKGGISMRKIGNDTLNAGPSIKGGVNFDTIYGGAGNDGVFTTIQADKFNTPGGLTPGFDKLKR